MYARYNPRPYPYRMRYYSLDPYYYGRYYNPYYGYSTNVIDSQVANVNQSINNFGDMIDVNQNSNIYQLRTPEPTPMPIEEPVTLPVEELIVPLIEEPVIPPAENTVFNRATFLPN